MIGMILQRRVEPKLAVDMVLGMPISHFFDAGINIDNADYASDPIRKPSITAGNCSLAYQTRRHGLVVGVLRRDSLRCSLMDERLARTSTG